MAKDFESYPLDEEDIEIGDVVRLKGGSPRMNVHNRDGTTLTVIWFDRESGRKEEMTGHINQFCWLPMDDGNDRKGK